MRLNKLLLIFFTFVIFAQSYSLGNSYKSQMAEMAKNYAEKTYDREFKIEKVNFGGYEVWLGAYKNTGWFTSKKLYECRVYIKNIKYAKNTNPDVPSIAGTYNVTGSSCGYVMIMQKLTKYIQSNFISKYYSLDNIDFSIGLRANAPLNSNLATEITHYISSESGSWNLPAKEWLVKYKDEVQIDNVFINIYNQTENAENIAKAMEFGYKLDKYLRSLTTSHKINGIYIYLYTYNKNYVVKHGGTIWYTRLKGDKYYKYLRNYFFTLGDGGYKGYIPITSSNREDNILIKNTNYYQPVKKILAEKFKNK